jgi:hypothetical protein
MQGPLVSGSAAHGAYRFGRAGLAGWADFSAWAESVPRGQLPFFESVFLFYRIALFCNKTCTV